jgi:hypothetical protein
MAPKQSKDDFVVVYKANGMMTAQIIKGKLESNGIPVLLKYESVGQTFGLTVDGLGEVKVMVAREQEQEARALLNEQ